MLRRACCSGIVVRYAILPKIYKGFKMTINESNEQFTPADICGWFNIPRTTLFRWEQLNEIPKADRGPKGERIYRREHLRHIVELLRKNVGNEMRSAIKHNPNGSYPTLEMQERLYRLEFFGEKNPKAGLQQLQGLARIKALSPDTVEALANRALTRPPHDELRAKIWTVLALNDGVAA